jgi:hypothetical protein
MMDWSLYIKTKTSYNDSVLRSLDPFFGHMIIFAGCNSAFLLRCACFSLFVLLGRHATPVLKVLPGEARK